MFPMNMKTSIAISGTPYMLVKSSGRNRYRESGTVMADKGVQDLLYIRSYLKAVLSMIYLS